MWFASSLNDKVVKIDVASRSIAKVIDLPDTSGGVAVSDGRHLWVPSHFDGTVTVIALDSGDVLDVIDVGLNPNDIVFDGSNIWVVGEGALATIPAR